MNQEYNSQLIQRSLDNALSPADREELARALRDDALLRSEAEEMKTVHACTESMFRQLALPADFSARVMKRVQAHDVPSDASHASQRIRLRRLTPARRSANRGIIWVSCLAAAAIVALAVALVIQLSGPGAQQKSTGPSLAGGGSGVPGTSEGNRTDSLTPSSGNREASDPKSGASQPVEEPALPLPEEPVKQPEEVRQPEGPKPEAPRTPGGDKPVEPKGEQPGGEVVETPAPAQPEKEPGAKVEVDPERKTNAEPQPATPTERPVLARLSILGGKAEMLGTDGKWKNLANDEEVRQGAQIRTNANGNASLVFADGAVTLAKASSVTLLGMDQVSLESGTVALDRPDARDGESLTVLCDAYSVYLMHGTAMVRRKTRGMELQHYVGLTTIGHEEFGSVIFDQPTAYEFDFGKSYPEVKPGGVTQAPDWVADARGAGLMAAIEPKLAERFGNLPRERREIDKNLPRALRRLMSWPLDQASALEFLTRALDNYKLDAATVVRMVGEVETAIVEIKDAVPNTVAYNAARSAMLGTVIDFNTWRDSFLRLARGETQRPPQASVPRKSTTEVIEAGKIRRVDNPPPTPKPVPKPDTEPKPEEPAKEEPAGK